MDRPQGPRLVRVLVVDPDPAVARSVSAILGARALVATAAGPIDAIAALRVDRFRVALVEHDLGARISGAEVLTAARARQPGCLRVLMGRGAHGMQALRLDGIADRLLSKPFHPGELASLLDDA